jgi:hypothetical protein
MAKQKAIQFVGEAMTAKGGLQYLYPYEHQRWCLQYPEQRVLVTMQLLSDIPTKMRMFAYLHGPLIDCLMIGYENAGYNELVSSDLYYILKTRYASEPWYNPVTKKEESRIIDFSNPKTPADRLHKFISDLIWHLEQDLGGEAPNSEEYNMKKGMWNKRSNN